MHGEEGKMQNSVVETTTTTLEWFSVLVHGLQVNELRLKCCYLCESFGG